MDTPLPPGLIVESSTGPLVEGADVLHFAHSDPPSGPTSIQLHYDVMFEQPHNANPAWPSTWPAKHYLRAILDFTETEVLGPLGTYLE